MGVVATMAIALAGCSSTKESSSSTTSTSAAPSAPTYRADKQGVCQARDQLQTSVKGLTDSTLLAKGTDAIKAAVTQVQTDLQSVKTAAKTDYEPQFTALQGSLEALETTVGDLEKGSLAQNMTAVGTAVATVGTDASALFTQLKTTCGS